MRYFVAVSVIVDIVLFDCRQGIDPHAASRSDCFSSEFESFYPLCMDFDRAHSVGFCQNVDQAVFQRVFEIGRECALDTDVRLGEQGGHECGKDEQIGFFRYYIRAVCCGCLVKNRFAEMFCRPRYMTIRELRFLAPPI